MRALVRFFALSGILVTSVVEAKPLPRSTNLDHPDWPEAELSSELRLERATRIRDSAKLVGMTNAVLLAGIGQVETGFAHCWSEATWACQGPHSSSCDGPVIAGSADGPCSAEQGGLGMFQFDAGTFDDTIATYGASIVTMEGNVEAVVPFLITRAIESVPGVDTEAEALAWMNSIPIDADDSLFQEWIYFVSWRYNGCKGCTSQQAKYRDGTLLLQEERGAAFWDVSELDDDCASVPAAGRIIEEDDHCYGEEGDSDYWRTEAAGHGGGLMWTVATDSETPSNQATWRLRFDVPGRYELIVFTDDGEFGGSGRATYEVSHAGVTDAIMIDQSSATGWHSLGLFEFDDAEDQHVRLSDNTGEPGVEGMRLMFDALRVLPERVDGDDDEPADEPGDESPDEETLPDDSVVSAMCSATGSTSGSQFVFVLFALLWLGSRRSARATRK